MKKLRTPKGTLDLSPNEALKQIKFIEKIKMVFERHHGQPIVTPSFELREVLCNKYGDESKLIYNLEDQGGDICSLRYDLTVPFSRYLAMNRINKMRRYQIGSVFRRDNPSFETGRLREFVQADFDICGEAQEMMNDAEVVKMADNILNHVGKEYSIRVNDRRIISGMLIDCGVEEELHRTVCSTIDKSDKMSMDDITIELMEKGFVYSQIARICEYIELSGNNLEKVEWVRAKMESKMGEYLESNENALIGKCLEGLKEMCVLFDYLSIYGVSCVHLDFSLARGLDYYTGMIFEAVIVGSKVGSVIGGGRYDRLTRQLSNQNTACVGFSVGVSRICTVLEAVKIDFGIFVGSFYGLLLKERMKILNTLWGAGISAETFGGKRVNPKEQIEYSRRNGFQAIVFLGENENERGKVVVIKLPDLEKNEINADELVEYLNSNINIF